MTELATRHGYLVVRCFCNATFEARTADRKRGWGIYCSKSCKATAQSMARNGSEPRHATAAQQIQEPETKKPPEMEPVEDWMVYRMFGIDMPDKSC